MFSRTFYPDYNSIAQINNEYYSHEYLNKTLPILKQLLLLDLSSGAHILDICCGVGRLAERLLNEGYQITGIDSSEEMLRYAHENATNGKFILGDVRFFELPPIFNGAVSTGDLNHITCLDDLTSVFQKVYQSLRLDGRFVFNLLLEEGFQSGWDDFVLSDVKDDSAWIVKNVYDPEEKMGKIKITGFRLIEENWQRLDDTMLFKSYSSDEVISALKKVGFSQVNIHYSEPDSQSNRHSEVYFVCCK